MARTAVRTQTTKRYEVVTTSSFGKEVFLDCHLVPFGEKGLLFIAQDITERKKQAEALSSLLRVPVYYGMRNWHPFLKDTLARMRSDGIQRIVDIYRQSGFQPPTIDKVRAYHGHRLVAGAATVILKSSAPLAVHEMVTL